MHSLIIKAHPRPDGFTHRIASVYAERQKSLWHTVEILELTEKENFQEYATFVDGSHLLEDEIVKRIQAKIIEADELVWIFPVWWMDCPAVMKNFWDRNFTSGFAFRYEWGKPIKLLTWKITKVFATAWGPGPIIGFFMGLIWKMGRCGFVGLKSTKFQVFGSFPKRTEQEKSEFLLRI